MQTLNSALHGCCAPSAARRHRRHGLRPSRPRARAGAAERHPRSSSTRVLSPCWRRLAARGGGRPSPAATAATATSSATRSRSTEPATPTCASPSTPDGRRPARRTAAGARRRIRAVPPRREPHRLRDRGNRPPAVCVGHVRVSGGQPPGRASKRHAVGATGGVGRLSAWAMSRGQSPGHASKRHAVGATGGAARRDGAERAPPCLRRPCPGDCPPDMAQGDVLRAARRSRWGRTTYFGSRAD